MQFSSVLASLLCLTSTLVTAIPLNASPRAAAVASITKITAVGGSACSSPSDWEEGFRDDAPATRQINYFNFGAGFNAPRDCNVQWTFSVVIPSDGKADLTMRVDETGFAIPDTDPNTGDSGRISHTVTAGGKTVSSQKDFLAGQEGNPLTTTIQFTVTGTPGTTVTQTATAKVTAVALGGNGFQWVDNTIVNFV